MSRIHNRCIVPSCKATPKSLHEIPSNLQRQKEWLMNIFKDSEEEIIEVPTRAHVCNYHFKKDCFRTNRVKNCLKPDATPTIFMEYPPEDYDDYLEEPEVLIKPEILTETDPLLTPKIEQIEIIEEFKPDPVLLEQNKKCDRQIQVETLSERQLQKLKNQIKALQKTNSIYRRQISQKNKRLQELKNKSMIINKSNMEFKCGNNKIVIRNEK